MTVGISSSHGGSVARQECCVVLSSGFFDAPFAAVSEIISVVVGVLIDMIGVCVCVCACVRACVCARAPRARDEADEALARTFLEAAIDEFRAGGDRKLAGSCQ